MVLREHHNKLIIYSIQSIALYLQGYCYFYAMKNYKYNFFVVLLLSVTLVTGCNDEATEGNQKVFPFKITNLSDKDYPDNPDIGYRSEVYKNDLFESGLISMTADSFVMNLSFFTKTDDTIKVKYMVVSELIPTIPINVKDDEYLSYISCINQEWNRNQLQFNPENFKTTIPNIDRVDIARNCLNAYLWEVIIYIIENGKSVPYAHGWFDFPHDLYAKLFERKNKIPFSKYKDAMENWVAPENKVVKLELLRKKLDSVEVSYTDKSDEMYPLDGARKKKFKEIIYPDTFTTMRDLQTDSAQFATFSKPGYYNKEEPRKTQLGRIYNLKNVQVNKVKHFSNKIKDTLREVQLDFTHKTNGKQTTLLIGGLDFKRFPVLPPSEANKGWKSSMGIGNHTFYELYKDHLHSKSEQSPYYALLLDGEGKWLDSHEIGIDGPIFHFEDEERKILHLWLLSFERHALVGHYVIELK